MAYSAVPTRTNSDTAIPYQDTNTLQANIASLARNTSALYVDDVNNVVGIGITPAAGTKLYVYRSASTDADAYGCHVYHGTGTIALTANRYKLSIYSRIVAENTDVSAATYLRSYSALFRAYNGTAAGAYYTNSLFGLNIEVSNYSNAGTIANVRGVSSSITSSVAGSTITDASLFYGTYGTVSATITNKYGLYVNGEDKNYLSNTLGIGTNAPTISDGKGIHIAGSILRLATAKTPATAGATGNAGEICWDSSYLYICIAANTWRRIAHSTW